VRRQGEWHSNRDARRAVNRLMLYGILQSRLAQRPARRNPAPNADTEQDNLSAVQE